MILTFGVCWAFGLAVYAVLAAGRKWVATAPTLFLILQTPFLIGLLQHLKPSDPVHVRYGVFVVFSLYAFVAGVIVANWTLGVRPGVAWRRILSRPLKVDAATQTGPMVLLGAASVLAGIAFVRAVGYNTFALALDGGSGGAKPNFDNLRAGATQSAYVAAGYTAQFTAVILPAIILLIVVRARTQSSLRLRLVAVVLTLADLYFITTVGGRVYVLSFFVSYALVSTPALTLLPSALSASSNTRRLLLPAFLVVFFALTSIQGRFGSDSYAASKRSPVIESAQALYNRLGGDYSRDQLKAMKILAPDGVRWGGQWSQDFLIVIPGPKHTGELVSTRLHRALYGSSKGNVPLNVWGSALYNWGMPVGVFIFFIFGLAMQWLSLRLLLLGRRSITAIVLGQLICLHVASAYDPYSLLLEGGVTLLIVRRLLLGGKPTLRPNAQGRSGDLSTSEIAHDAEPASL